MLKGLGDLGNIVKLQKDIKNIQKKISESVVECESKDMAVKATINGEFKILTLKIDEGITDAATRKKIENAVIDSINGAIKKIKDYSESEIQNAAGGIDLSLMKKFFQ
jgi:DNA-binding protein YbaB